MNYSIEQLRKDIKLCNDVKYLFEQIYPPKELILPGQVKHVLFPILKYDEPIYIKRKGPYKPLCLRCFYPKETTTLDKIYKMTRVLMFLNKITMREHYERAVYCVSKELMSYFSGIKIKHWKIIDETNIVVIAEKAVDAVFKQLECVDVETRPEWFELYPTGDSNRDNSKLIFGKETIKARADFIKQEYEKKGKQYKDYLATRSLEGQVMRELFKYFWKISNTNDEIKYRFAEIGIKLSDKAIIRYREKYFPDEHKERKKHVKSPEQIKKEEKRMKQIEIAIETYGKQWRKFVSESDVTFYKRHK